mgnify:CR=1 FL=1
MRGGIGVQKPAAGLLAQNAKIASLLAGGRVRIHVDAVLPFAEAAKAHELGEAGHTKGKIVLSLPE